MCPSKASRTISLALEMIESGLTSAPQIILLLNVTLTLHGQLPERAMQVRAIHGQSPERAMQVRSILVVCSETVSGRLFRPRFVAFLCEALNGFMRRLRWAEIWS
jgi:hypothetical protein